MSTFSGTKKMVNHVLLTSNVTTFGLAIHDLVTKIVSLLNTHTRLFQWITILIYCL